MRDGLFAEDSLAGGGSRFDQGGVRVGRRADHHGVDLGVVQHILGIGRGLHLAEGSGAPLGRLQPDVGDDLEVGIRDAVGQMLGVQCADAARADEAEA